MSTWVDRFKNDQIHTWLEQLANHLAEMPKTITDPVQVEDWQRLKAVVVYMQTALKRVEPRLATPQMLTNVSSNLTPVRDSLSQYKATNDFQHVRNANGQIDSAIYEFGRLPLVLGGKQSESLDKIVAGYETGLNQLLANLAKEATVQQNTQAQQIKLLTEQVVQAQAIAGEVKNQASQTRESVSGTMTALQASFEESQKNRELEFKNIISESDRKFKNLGEKLEQKLRDAEGQIESFYRQTYSKLEEYKKQAADILGVISATGLAGGYMTEANQDDTEADWLRIWGVGLIFWAGIAALLLTHWSINHNLVEMKQVLMKIPVLLLLVFPGAYLLRESSRHRDTSIRNRKKQLELTALGPYLESLPQAKKEELKEKLAEKFFGTPLESSKSGDVSNVSINTFTEVVEKFLDTIRGLTK